MANFLLIHGSFVGGWVWQPTVELLQKAGHAVYAPSTDGSAERKGSVRSDLSLTGVATELADLLFYEDLADVTVAATSSGGMIVQAMAPRARDRIGRIVLVDTLMPMPGEKISDIVTPRKSPPYAVTELTRAPSREAMEQGLFAELTGAIKAWALDRATPYPRALSEPKPGETDAFWQSEWKATVVRCTRSLNPPESHQRRTAATLKGHYREMDWEHYPMLTDPIDMAKLLQEEAARR
jgi:pimeloyl-ACP methyl ester carboxylesterase